MGRRKKAAKKIVQKKKHVVPTQFKCLFCNSEGSVACKLSLSSMVGQLQCRVCDARFETQINSLTDPIDVFSEWLDEAEELQEQHNKKMEAEFLSRGADDEGGLEMVEPAAKRARVEEPNVAEVEPESNASIPAADPLKGLEVDSDDEEEKKGDEVISEDQEKAEYAKPSEDDEQANQDDDEDEGEVGGDEANETWKDVASPVPENSMKAPEMETQLQSESATQPQGDVDATQAQQDDTQDLF